MKIALVVGHSESSQGASSDGVTEWEFNSQLVRDIKSQWGRHKYSIFYRRPRTEYWEAMGILANEIEEWGADIAIEFHFNASASAAEGHEVLYHHKSLEGKKLARLIDSKFDKHLENTDRGVKPIKKGHNGFGFVHRVKCPAVIVEPFFARNLRKYLSGEPRTRLIRAYAQGFHSL